MIVFDLNCSHGHRFEAWFGSSRDYDDQQARGLVSCPLCNDAHVTKAVMAPAVGAKGNQRDERQVASRQPEAVGQAAAGSARAVATMDPAQAGKIQEIIGKLAQVQAQMLENSAWVGDGFAEKARAMHYGDAPMTGIHGTAKAEEARSLLEEGIAIAPLPLPVVPPEDRN
ncbi:MAG: DUF1178 family protein [Sphingobium sp.]